MGFSMALICIGAEQRGPGISSSRQSTRGQQEGLQLEAEATCTHLIERNRDAGRIQIAMGICNAETNAQL
jgi:hypothetical protein